MLVQVPCFYPQAHKLGMTGPGYVWLLVGWYNHQWWEAYDEINSECSVEETKEAVESSFYIATETTHLSTKQGPTIAHIVSKHALSVSLIIRRCCVLPCAIYMYKAVNRCFPA